MKSKPKIALVYDRVNKIGGAERVLETLFELFPEAPLYTSVYNPSTAKWAREIHVKPSFLQRFSWARENHEYFAWAMPSVVESFDFDQYDIVISVTSAEAKGLITKPGTLHLCYLLTPTRYLWSHAHFYADHGVKGKRGFLKPFMIPMMSNLRMWDYYAAQRPDKIAAISEVVQDRVKKYYRREVDAIISPPVEPLPTPDQEYELPEEYYLIVSRLVPYKRIGLAIKACNQLKKRLVIVGEGSQLSELKNIAGETITFAGKVSQSKLSAYYRNCKALLFPGEEDFGIVCVEAQSVGKPVICYSAGGAAEIIQNHTTGVFFDQQEVKSIVEAIKSFETMHISAKACQRNSQRFSVGRFKKSFSRFVEESWENHLKTNI